MSHLSRTSRCCGGGARRSAGGYCGWYFCDIVNSRDPLPTTQMIIKIGTNRLNPARRTKNLNNLFMNLEIKQNSMILMSDICALNLIPYQPY